MKTVRRLLSLGTALLLAGGVAGCDGSNVFVDPPVKGGGTGTTPGADTVPPVVQIRLPRDSAAVAVGDSVFVEVRVADNVALDSVHLEGFSLRGDPSLGTQVRIERFQAKVVKLDSATQRRVVSDTILTRYLRAARDSTPDGRVFVVVSARDRAGRESRDTSVVSVGGPPGG